MRYFLKLSYNGSSFHGWQSQPNATGVQSVLEDGLSTILRKKITVLGAGRTDTGVHAREMFAHLDLEEKIQDKKRFLQSLNSIVGRNISVPDILEVIPEAHARFDAEERTYKYFVTYDKNPFLKDFCWFSASELDIQKMNEAADILLSTKDFTSFAKLHSDSKTNICDVREALWKPLAEDKEALNFLGNLNKGIVFTISADRFLRNMVRAIVGTLVEVGRHKLTLLDFKKVIEDMNRSSAGTSMPAHGLFLWKISYPESLFLSAP